MEKKYELELKRIFFFLVYKKKYCQTLDFQISKVKLFCSIYLLSTTFLNPNGAQNWRNFHSRKTKTAEQSDHVGSKFWRNYDYYYFNKYFCETLCFFRFFSEISPEGRSGLSTRRNCLGRTVGGGRWRDPRYISNLNFGRTIGDGQRQQLTCR